RQYSWRGAYGVPQRGHSPAAPSVGGVSTGGSLTYGAGSTLAAASASSVSTACPQAAQNFAPAGTAPPQLEQARTGCSPCGRPQLAQKCEPQRIGAPHAHRAAGAARRALTATARSESSSWSRSSIETSSADCSSTRSWRKPWRRYIS